MSTILIRCLMLMKRVCPVLDKASQERPGLTVCKIALLFKVCYLSLFFLNYI